MIKTLNSLDKGGNIVDLTTAATDYPLSIGETATITFSSSTSVPLRVATVEGAYEIMLILIDLASSPTNVNTWLNPNNTTYSGKFKEQYLGANGSSVTGGLATNNAMSFGFAGVIQYQYFISTMTAGKSCLSIGMFKGNDGAYMNNIASQYWEDKSTVWASLGTLVFQVAKSGKIVIRRTA